MTNVTVRQAVISTVSGQVGNWAIRKDFALSRAPVPGEYLELAPGWSSCRIRDITHCADGSVHADLDPCKTDSPDILTDLARLVSGHGWEQLGGPWKGQTP